MKNGCCAQQKLLEHQADGLVLVIRLGLVGAEEQIFRPTLVPPVWEVYAFVWRASSLFADQPLPR